MKDKVKSGIKWLPVAVAAIVAVVQNIGEQKDKARIDDMDERIKSLENKSEES